MIVEIPIWIRRAPKRGGMPINFAQQPNPVLHLQSFAELLITVALQASSRRY